MLDPVLERRYVRKGGSGAAEVAAAVGARAEGMWAAVQCRHSALR